MQENKKKKKHKVARALLILIGGIFVIWFLLPPLTGVIPNIGTFTGLGVFGLLLLYGIFLDPVNRFLGKLWKSKAGRAVEIIVGAVLAVIFILAGITYGCMLHAAGKDAKPESNVIVLGCKVNGNNPSLTLLSRLEAALDYLEENPDSLVSVSGGQGPGEIVTEASVMSRWLNERGIEAERIIVEDEARDTAENFRFSEKLLKEKSPEAGKDLVVITSDFHMYRALRIAKSLGYQATPFSADTPWWLYPTYVVREMYGILESWLTLR